MLPRFPLSQPLNADCRVRGLSVTPALLARQSQQLPWHLPNAPLHLVFCPALGTHPLHERSWVSPHRAPFHSKVRVCLSGTDLQDKNDPHKGVFSKPLQRAWVILKTRKTQKTSFKIPHSGRI